MRAIDRQTDRQTDILITILRTASGDEVMNRSKLIGDMSP